MQRTVPGTLPTLKYFCWTKESHFSGTQPKGAASSRVTGGAPTLRAAALGLLAAWVWGEWVCAGCVR